MMPLNCVALRISKKNCAVESIGIMFIWWFPMQTAPIDLPWPWDPWCPLEMPWILFVGLHMLHRVGTCHAPYSKFLRAGRQKNAWIYPCGIFFEIIHRFLFYRVTHRNCFAPQQIKNFLEVRVVTMPRKNVKHNR